MHLVVLFSLALGFGCVAASPCKPTSPSIATTTTAVDTLGRSRTLSTDTTTATEQSYLTATTSLAISDSSSPSSVSSSALLSDTATSSEQTELTGTTTIAVSKSTSVADLESTTSVALSDTSLSTPIVSLSQRSIPTSGELTSSAGIGSTTSATTSVAAPITTTTQSTTDSAVPLTHTSSSSTLEATTALTTASTHTTLVDEVSTSTAETSTALLPIPTLFSLSAQGGPADGLTLLSNGLPEYSIPIGTFSTWRTGQFTYDEVTGHILNGANALCALSYQGNFNYVSIILCPTVMKYWHAPLVCDRPTGSNLKCSVAATLYTCTTDSGGVRTCTNTYVSWSNMYSAFLFDGAYQLRMAAADWNHDSTVDSIDLLVTPL